MSDQLSMFLVNATFVFLVGASALTWAIVIVKALQQRRLTKQTLSFADAFGKLAGVPSVAELNKHAGPAARVALAGAEAWHDSAKGSGDLDVRTDLLERSLKQQLVRERRGVEAGLPVLASVGSTSPFVGARADRAAAQAPARGQSRGVRAPECRRVEQLRLDRQGDVLDQPVWRHEAIGVECR
jgi:biopolymer transport protein ExbB